MVSQAPYDDEGVYVMAAQLLRQGALPYRDFFFAHPPLGLLAIVPALSVAFTAWGSPLSFGLARLLMVLLGVLTVLCVGLAGRRLWGATGGTLAALALALDPPSIVNSRHILLEVPLTLLLAASLLALVVAVPTTASDAGRTGRHWVGLGLLTGLAILIKLQAGSLALAIGLIQLGRRRWSILGRLAGGWGVSLLLLLPLLWAVDGMTIMRQVVLFQLLRPGDGLETTGERLLALIAPSGLMVGLIGAGLGLVGLTMTGWRSLAAAQRPILMTLGLWLGLGLLSFLLSRSYYQHYASQLSPGLALLAGAQVWPSWRGVGWRRWLGGGLLGLWLLVAASLAVERVALPRPDAIFTIVAHYLSDAARPDQAVLPTDAQFAYLASRPLPQTEAGYLVDSYGQLIFTGLGLEQAELVPSLIGLMQAQPAVSVHEVMTRPAAQALLRRQMAAAELVVVHAVGRGRLSPETVHWLSEGFQLVERTGRYEIYRRRA
jgi:hypothetical protein